MNKSFRKQKEKLLSLTEKLTDTLDLPDTAVPGTAHIELSGNKEAVVDGCKGVLQYDEDIIRLNTGRLTVCFRGSDLCIRSMQAEQVFVCGHIITIEFLQ
ncbi:MAG: YabP/YqfC family sporulation protein [Clostridia bacterium]|nr:YabP/YqfC family sporulation protein [Clostridia bacterium]